MSFKLSKFNPSWLMYLCHQMNFFLATMKRQVYFKLASRFTD